jgi:lysophospholipase L1-like esterase
MFRFGKFRLRIAEASVVALLAAPVFAGNETNYTYLALGESVSYGLDPTLLPTAPGQPLPTPDQFVGYPEFVAKDEHLQQSKKEINASCPGETTASFWIPGAPDNGCHGLGPQGQPPFKTWIGLHTNYAGTQLEFAVSQLASNKHINLVTLSIGGNDVLLVLENCANAADIAACVNAQLTAVFNAYGQNLAHILAALRAQYAGTLVLVTYFSPSPDLNGVASALNSVMTQVGSQFDAKFADGFGTFQLASAPFQGDPCKAGLLVRLSPSTCDVHPSPAGQQLLAAAVEFAIGGNQNGDGTGQKGNN